MARQAGRHGHGQGRAKQIVIAGPYPNPIQPTPVPDIAPSLVFCASLGLSAHQPCAFLFFPFPPFLYTPTRSTQSLIKDTTARDIDCSKRRFTSGIDIEIKTTVLSHPLVLLGTVFWPCWILSLSRPSSQTHTPLHILS